MSAFPFSTGPEGSNAMSPELNVNAETAMFILTGAGEYAPGSSSWAIARPPHARAAATMHARKRLIVECSDSGEDFPLPASVKSSQPIHPFRASTVRSPLNRAVRGTVSRYVAQSTSTSVRRFGRKSRLEGDYDSTPAFLNPP